MRGVVIPRFDCNFTDSLVLGVPGLIRDIDEEIDHDLDLYDTKEKYEANTDQTFADNFIDQAERLFEERGDFRRNPLGRSRFTDLREKIKDFDYWRAFMETLAFSIDVFSSGDIRRLVKHGVVHVQKNVDGGRKGGKKSVETRQKKAKSTKEARQAIAEEIWKKDPELDNSKVAGKIIKRHGEKYGKHDTIRKAIINPFL